MGLRSKSATTHVGPIPPAGPSLAVDHGVLAAAVIGPTLAVDHGVLGAAVIGPVIPGGVTAGNT